MDQLQQVTDWLNQLANRPLLVTKVEDGDLDQVHLTLHKVTLGTYDQEDPDDYVAKYALLLQGEGSIHNGLSEAPLPLNAYEIPLTETLSVQQESHRLAIKTERASYEIKLQS